MTSRRLRAMLSSAVLVGSLAAGPALLSGTASAASSAAAAAKPFTLSGTLLAANTHTHRISVRVGPGRQSIVTTARTRVLLGAHRITLYALRPRMTVTVQGVVRARWREALQIRVGPGPVANTVQPAPANASLQTALTAALAQERAALATYQNVVAKFGSIRPFANVIPSEQRHVSTLEAFFAEYKLALPTGAVSGTAAPATVSAACGLGVTTERALVSLYDAQLPNVAAFADVHQAFEAFRTVSMDRHLTAFEHCS